MTTANGLVGPRLTQDYRPRVLSGLATMRDHLGPWTLRDLERMRVDSRIKLGLRTIKAPLHVVKWMDPNTAEAGDLEPGQGIVRASDPAVGDFVTQTLKHFWKNSLTPSLLMIDYGRSCAEVVNRVNERTGLIELDALYALYPHDCTPLEYKGEMVGLRCKPLSVDLPVGRYLYLVNEPEFSPWYGKSRVLGAWEPWSEKSNRHGAKDVRRLWFVKNAFRGGTIRHPNGMIDLGNGTTRSCQDYGMEILERMETGGILALPNAKDEATGEYLWTYEPPVVNGDIKGILEYVGEVDTEILEGMEIMPEVIEAQTTGSWAGRSVPFLVFLTGEDQICNTIVGGFDRQCIRPLVDANYGREADYEIEVQSFVPKDQEAGGSGGQATAAPDANGGGSGVKDLASGKVQYGVQLSTVRLGMVGDEWHGPESPGAGWVQVGTGPHGGKIWKQTGQQAKPAHGFDWLQTADDPAHEQQAEETVKKTRGIAARIGRWLSQKTDIPGIQQVKQVLGGALKKIGAAQVKLMQVMKDRYGSKTAKGIFIAAQLTGSNPLIMPPWFVALPGSTLLAQLPLMGVAEGVLQLSRAAKAAKRAVGLSLEEGQDLTDEQVQEAAVDLLKQLYGDFLAELEPHKEQIGEAMKGFSGEEDQLSLAFERGMVIDPADEMRRKVRDLAKRKYPK